MSYGNYLKTNPSLLKSCTSPESKAQSLVKQREGLVLRWYPDSLGKITGGYGHLQLPHERGMSITKALADKWFVEDITASDMAATIQAGQLKHCTQELKDVLVSVNFQLGTSWITKFKKTWALMLSGDYVGAAWEAENSLWAKQTPVRVRDLQFALVRLDALKDN